jgi:lysophospholipase L1-like esterase
VWTVYYGQDSDVFYSRQGELGWQPARPLSASPEVFEDSPSLAFVPDGTSGETTAWAAWAASTGTDQAEIYVSHWLGDSWASPEPVPGTGMLRGDQPFLAAGPDGELWLAWIGHDGIDREVYVSHWDGASWSLPLLVGRDDQDPMAYDTHPRLAVDGSGRAWLVWVSYEGSLNDEIHASYWDGSAWSPQQPISMPDDTPDVWPAIALDAEGQPWVAWQGAETDDLGRWRIYLSHWDSQVSSWSDESHASSSPHLPLEERRPSLAFDSKGFLHLAWAVLGEGSGIARTIWDRDGWAAPTWLETGAPVDSLAVVAGGVPALYWLASAGDGATPFRQMSLAKVVAPLSAFPSSQMTSPYRAYSAVPDRHLAHGDSITWAQYNDLDGQPVVPYPVFLEGSLVNNVSQSEVINHGKPGEKARASEARLRQGIQIHSPEFVEIMEGTNDLSGGQYSPAETAYAVRLLVRVVKEFPGTLVMIATIIPRRDKWNGDVDATNQLLHSIVAPKEKVPIADPWQAYYNYGPWEGFYVDVLHPDTKGMEILATTFFQKIVDVGWLPQDPNPPTAWITSLPAKSDCFVPVEWTGDDGTGSGIASYDLQVQINGGSWTNWLVETPQEFGFYVGQDGQSLAFRVRARDQVGNVGDYSAPDTTQVECSGPIQRAYLPTLSRNSLRME